LRPEETHVDSPQNSAIRPVYIALAATVLPMGGAAMPRPEFCYFVIHAVACVLTGVAYFVDDFLQRRGGPRFNWWWSYG
jgi:hypothetical protein